MPSSNKVNNVWGSARLDVELECPSGQFCLVKKPDPQQLVTMGVIDHVDTLSKLVDTKHVKRVKGSKPSATPAKVDVAAIRDNPKIASDIIGLADKVVEAVVLEPNVLRPIMRTEGGAPKLINDGKGGMCEVALPYRDRDPDQIYTDMIDFLDRMYIFQHAVGGSTDLATFRRELDIPVPGVANGDKISVSAVGNDGN